MRKISRRSTRPTVERSNWRCVPSPQSKSSRSPPRRTSSAGGERRAVGALPEVPRKTTSRSTAADRTRGSARPKSGRRLAPGVDRAQLWGRALGVAPMRTRALRPHAGRDNDRTHTRSTDGGERHERWSEQRRRKQDEPPPAEPGSRPRRSRRPPDRLPARARAQDARRRRSRRSPPAGRGSPSPSGRPCRATAAWIPNGKERHEHQHRAPSALDRARRLRVRASPRRTASASRTTGAAGSFCSSTRATSRSSARRSCTRSPSWHPPSPTRERPCSP